MDKPKRKVLVKTPFCVVGDEYPAAEIDAAMAEADAETSYLDPHNVRALEKALLTRQEAFEKNLKKRGIKFTRMSKKEELVGRIDWRGENTPNL